MNRNIHMEPRVITVGVVKINDYNLGNKNRIISSQASKYVIYNATDEGSETRRQWVLHFARLKV